MSSHKVALSAAFLALAAGGTAACDAYPDDDTDRYETVYNSESDGYSAGDDPADSDTEEAADLDEASGDEVFYCADEDGEIVDEDDCDTAGGSSSYFLWHSTGYSRGLAPGTTLDGGDRFPAGDRASRRAFELPATGTVSNGTVKTNVVGRSSGGSGTGSGSGSTSGDSSGSTFGGSSGG
jgi:hypothetical protein